MDNEFKKLLDKNTPKICGEELFFIIPKTFESYLTIYRNPIVTDKIISKSLEEYKELSNTI